MNRLIRPVLAVACIFAAHAGVAATVSLSLPENWRDGEDIAAINGYVRISAPCLVAPAAPVAAPSLPAYVFEVDLPKGANVGDISAEVEWGDAERLEAPVVPIAEAVPLPGKTTIPEPDPEIYALSAYPPAPAENGGTHIMRGRMRLAVRFTPYLYNPQERTIRRAVSARVTVECGGPVGRSAMLRSVPLPSAGTAQFVIVSPPAFTGLWQAYVDYRAETHPGLSISIANTADMYAAHPDAVAKGDYALAIHKYLEDLYDGGNGALTTVLLGAGAPGRTSSSALANWHSFTNKFLPFDPDTQIPTRYTAVYNCKAYEACDMYYACMDKTDSSAREVWDYDGDGVYMATLKPDGTMVNEPAANVDWGADLEVMRVPLQPLAVETSSGQALTGDVVATLTAERQMANFLAKIRLLESPAWHGAGRSAILGETTIANFEEVDKMRGDTSVAYLHEHEFFDGASNPFATDRENVIQMNETAMRYRIWQFAAGTRANGRVLHCIGADDCLPGPYGAADGAISSKTSWETAYAAIKAADLDALNLFSHGWARGSTPISSLELLRGSVTGVSRVYFAGKPCDTGMFDYAREGQTITNRLCLGGAAVLAPGGAAASFNNSREGIWYDLDNEGSSQIDGLVMCAVYNGNCTNAAFDAANPAVASPVTMGRALLVARQRAAVVNGGRFAKYGFNSCCFLEMTGFGDPLMTLSPQPDATDDLSKECVRTLSLTANASVSATNSAAVVAVGPAVSSISGDGILRATVETDVSGNSLDWSVAGGMGRKVAFASAGGRLSFSGDKKRYVGPAFRNVGELAVAGSGVTVDFGLASDNATCPVGRISFVAAEYGTNVLRNANRNAPANFFPSTVAVANSTLRAETSSAFPAALTNAELRVEVNPLWRGVEWGKAVDMKNGRFAIAADGFSFADGTTFNVSGDGGASARGGAVVDETGADAIAVSGALNVNLSNGGWFTLGAAVRAVGADGSLVVRGDGVLCLPHLPLAGFTNVVVGSGVTLVLPGSASSPVLVMSGGASSALSFEGEMDVRCGGDMSALSPANMGEAMNLPVVRGGTIVPDGASSMANPPYERTLSSALESWFNSSAWTGNGIPFADTWANSQTYSGEVVLRVADGADEISLSVEGGVSENKLVVTNAANASAPGNLAITADNLQAGMIDASGYSGTLSLDFDLGGAALVANADTRVLRGCGAGALTIPQGGRATLSNGAWSGAVENSGVLKRLDSVMAASTSLPTGTNSFVQATLSGNDNTVGRSFLVEDGDALTCSDQQHSTGFCVTGGRLAISNSGGGVWIGRNSNTPQFYQTGGTTTVYTATGTASSPYDSGAGMLLLMTGSGSYSMTVAGGRLEVPNGYLIFWGNGATCTVTGGGVLAAKGVSANTAKQNRRLVVSGGGIFELGEIGICEKAPNVAVSGGVLAATANASIRSAISLSDATLAASDGRTLTVATPFETVSGSLTIGTAAYPGAVDIGTNRYPGVSIGADSRGTLKVSLTEAELSTGEANFFSCADEAPAGLSIVCKLPNGSMLPARAVASGGRLSFAFSSRQIIRPEAAWNGDFADGATRGIYTLALNGNPVGADGAVNVIAGSSGGVKFTVPGRDYRVNHLAVVAGLRGVAQSSSRRVLASTVDALSGKNVLIGFGADSGVVTGFTESWGEFAGGSTAWPDSGLHDFAFFYDTEYDTAAFGLHGFIDGESAYSSSKLVYGAYENRTEGASICGLPSAATANMAGASLSRMVVLLTTNAADIAAWSATGATNSLSVADGGTFGGILSGTGVNLSGGTVTLGESAIAAEMFVQEDTTLVVPGGATLSVLGPLYVAQGAKLRLSVASRSGFGPGSVLLAAYNRAFEDGQIVPAWDADFGDFAFDGTSGEFRFTPRKEDFFVYANSLPAGLAPTNGVNFASGEWTGTVLLTNVAAKTLPLDWYGGANSTVRLTGVSGYPGASGSTNIVFDTTIELVDGADGTPAWTLDNGYSSDCTTISRLVGGGTMKSKISPSNTYIRQGITVLDASGFTGSLDLKGTMFTFGSTVRKNDSSQSGTIFVDAGYSVTNMASWKAHSLVVNGELVNRGVLDIDTSVKFGPGASFVVDSLPADGVVLTAAAITKSGRLSVAVLGDGERYKASIVDNGDGTNSLVLSKKPFFAISLQ